MSQITNLFTQSSGPTQESISFQAYLPSADANATGNGTQFEIGSVTPLTIVWNDGGGMATNGVFTAPSTGKYAFFLSVFTQGTDPSHTTWQPVISTSTGTNYNLAYQSGFSNVAAGGFLQGNGGTMVELSAGDTVTFKIIVSGGAQTVTVYGSGNTNGLTYMSGYKVY